MLRDVTYTFWSENRVQDCAVRPVAVAAGRRKVIRPIIMATGRRSKRSKVKGLRASVRVQPGSGPNTNAGLLIYRTTSLFCIVSNAMTPHTCFWRHFATIILPSRFSHGDLFEWRHSSFFCCLIVIVNFQVALILSSVCRSLLSFKTKKWGETWTLTSADDLTLHAKALHRVPINSSPNSILDQLWRSTVRLQRSLAEMHTMESLLSTAECQKSTKNSFQASRSGPQRRKKSPGLRRWRAGREQGHLLLRLRRPFSQSLVLIQPCAFFLRHLQLSRRPGNLFYLVTPVKSKPKSAHGVRTLAFKHACGLMSCSTRQPASSACRSTQITGMVTSIVVLRFARTPPPLCHSWKEFFAFVWERRRNRQRALRDLAC